MTDIQKGLSQSEADEKIRRGECNGSFSVKSKSVGRIFADNIFTLFNLINVIIAVLVALVGAYRNMLFMGVILCNIARCAKRRLPVVGNCAVEFKFHTFTDCPIHRFIGGFAVAAGDRCTGGLSDIILLNTEDG